jgi:hypothetical protein
MQPTLAAMFITAERVQREREARHRHQVPRRKRRTRRWF